MRRIYLDHAATTPLFPAAREAMLPWLGIDMQNAGNPSSLYAEGRRARDAVDSARERLSRALGCEFGEVAFTSGGTEAANLAILGTALRHRGERRNRILLGAAEHHCVLHTRSHLVGLGYRVDLVPVSREAIIDLSALTALVGDDVLLVSLMHANNELGTLNPITALADVVHRAGALLHVDAVQTFLKPESRWSVGDLRADLVTVSAHKVNGPKGMGAVYVRAGVKLAALVGGGGQEREVRGGTENVAAIVGFAAAVGEDAWNRPAVDPRVRDEWIHSLEMLGAVRTVVDSPVLNGHVHVRFPGRDAGTSLIALDRRGVSASSGAACSSGSVEPSHVLLACGYPTAEAREGVRFTLSAETTEEDLAYALTQIREVLRP